MTKATKVTEEIEEISKTPALDLAMAQINKQFGNGSVMRLGESSINKDIEHIPTGSLTLDHALGIGGVPKGRIIEIYGSEGAGKTTLSLSVIANAQKQGGECAFVDVEHALDPAYAEKIGINIDELIISQPNNGEQALQIVEMLVRSGQVDVVVVDSVAALVPAREIEGEMGDSHMGLQARLMSQAMRKLNGVVADSNTCLIFTNQIRMKIGVMFGNPETTPGGNALKFYSSVRMDIRRIGQIKKGDDIIGAKTKVKIVKNKMASPFKIAEFNLYFGKGISLTNDLLTLGIKSGHITKGGAWYSYKDDLIGQGLEKAIQYLDENTEVRDILEAELRKHFGLE